MKELKKEIREILFELELKGFYPIAIYHYVCDNKGKNIRFYLNDKNKVSQEVFYDDIEEKHHRKELTDEEIKWVANNMFSYEKIKRIC